MYKRLTAAMHAQSSTAMIKIYIPNITYIA